MSQAVAKKIREKAKESAMEARNVKRGKVVKANPLTVELLTDDRILNDDDFDLSQWVRFYDKEFGIGKGDTVLLMREGGDWTVTDVISQKSMANRWLVQAGGNDGGDPSHDHR